MSNELFNNPFRGAVQREPMTFAEILYVFKLYRFYFIGFISFAVVATIYSHFSFRPSFVASSRVSMQNVKKDSVGVLAGIDIGGHSSEEQQIERYLTYMHSTNFMLSVAQELKARQGVKAEKISLPQPSVSRYEALKARLSLSSPVKKNDIDYSDVNLIPLEKLAEAIGSMVNIRAGESNTIYSTVSSEDPNTAIVLANLISETFTGQIMNKDRQEINEVQSFIEDRLRETTDKLQKSEFDLVNFKREHNIVSTADNTRLTVDRFGKIESDAEQLKIQIKESERLLSYYGAKLEQNDNEITKNKAPGISNDEAFSIRSRIETLRKQQSSLRAQGLAENENVMSGIDKDLSENAQKLKSYLRSGNEKNDLSGMDSESIREKISQLKQTIKQSNVKLAEILATRDELRQTMTGLPKIEQEKQGLERSVALQYELYTQLKKRLQEVEIQKAGLKNPVGIDELARDAQSALPPRLILRLIFSILAGFFMGCVVTMLVELMNSTVKHRADLEIAELISLGNLPFIDRITMRRQTNERYRPDLLVCAREPDSAESMAFKFLRAQLRNVPNSAGPAGHVVAISSSERGAGKSLVSANLAVSFSQLQRRTIIVDCDIRNPSQPCYFGHDNRLGLATLLEMKASLSDVLIKEKLPFLDIMPAGIADRNPTEIISSDKFKMLIGYLKTKYDHIIIDSPPALFVVDAAIVTAIADTAVLVARYRRTKRDSLIMAHRKVLQIAPKAIYGVLNGIHGVHEYTNYDASSYFENKLRSIRYFQKSKPKVESEGELHNFEDYLKADKTSDKVG